MTDLEICQSIMGGRDIPPLPEEQQAVAPEVVQRGRFSRVIAYVGALAAGTAIILGVSEGSDHNNDAVAAVAFSYDNAAVNDHVVADVSEAAAAHKVAAAKNSESSANGSTSASESEKDTFVSFHYDAKFDPANNPNKTLPHDFGVALKGTTIPEKLADWEARNQMTPLPLAATRAEMFNLDQSDAAINADSDAMKKNPELWKKNYNDVIAMLSKDTTTVTIEPITSTYGSLYIKDGKIAKDDNVNHGGSALVITYVDNNGVTKVMKLRVDCGGQNVWFENEQAKFVEITKIVKVTETVNNTVNHTVNNTVTKMNTVTQNNTVTKNNTSTAVSTVTNQNTVNNTVTATATETAVATTTVKETAPGTTVTVTTTTGNGKGEVPVTTTETVPTTVIKTLPGTTVTETLPGTTVTKTLPGTTVTETAPGTTVTVTETVPTTVTVTTTANGKGEVPTGGGMPTVG